MSAITARAAVDNDSVVPADFGVGQDDVVIGVRPIRVAVPVNGSLAGGVAQRGGDGPSNAGVVPEYRMVSSAWA